jgi:hypothetical protein
MELLTELNERLIFERSSIISDDPAGTAKSGYDILQEADNYFVGCTFGGGSFYPLGEIIYCSEDPSVLAT